MKRHRLMALIAGSLIAGSAVAQEGNPIKLGVPVGLSGANSVVAPSVVRAAELAVAENNDTARIRSVTFRIGCGLAALAGVLLTPLTSTDPTMGVTWLVGSFLLVMVAGESFAALAAACLIFGGAQVLVSTYVSPTLGGVTVAVLAALVLRISPEGLSRA